MEWCSVQSELEIGYPTHLMEDSHQYTAIVLMSIRVKVVKALVSLVMLCQAFSFVLCLPEEYDQGFDAKIWSKDEKLQCGCGGICSI